MVPCRVYSESVSNFSFDTLGDDSEAGRAERYRAPRGMGGAREGRAKGEKRGMGAAPPSRLDIYSFLFRRASLTSGASKLNQRPRVQGANVAPINPRGAAL